jgi:hypothetical protein
VECLETAGLKLMDVMSEKMAKAHETRIATMGRGDQAVDSRGTPSADGNCSSHFCATKIVTTLSSLLYFVGRMSDLLANLKPADSQILRPVPLL